MPDLFSVPIVVSVVDAAEAFKPRAKNRPIKTHIFWTNGASEKIKKAVMARDSKKIEAYIGVDPFNVPPPPAISSNFKVIGGDDDGFTLDDITDVINETDANDDRDITMSRRFGTMIFTSAKDVKYARDITIYDEHWVFPDDNLTDFKKKIQVASGIPTYRQHLWYEVNGDVFCPCYELHVGKQRLPVNIWQIKNNTSIVMGMPVDQSWYARRSEIRIYNNENTVLLRSIYDMSPAVNWYVADLNDIMNPHRKQFSDSIGADIHLRELVYYSFIIRYWPMITNSVFQMFVTNEPDLHNEYPELALIDSSLRKQLNLQTSLIGHNYNPSISKIPISVAINASNITTASEHFTYGKTINIRNLFDNIVTTESMPYVKCRTVLNNIAYTLIKRMKGGKTPRYLISPRIECLVIMFVLSDIADMFVYIYANGTYNIKTDWREDKKINLQDVTAYMISHANPILNMINKMGENVLARKLMHIGNNNILILDADIVITLKRRLLSDEFEALQSNLQKFKSVNFVHITSQDNNTISFHLLRGMHNFDNARYNSIINTTNGYSHNTRVGVRQKWESIYVRQKLCVLQNRTNDVYIKSVGLSGDEFSSFIRYMLIIVHMSIHDKSSMIVSTDDSARLLSHLKESDPVLYDLKRIYDDDKMYSQICQKPNQPKLVSTPSKKSVKFWNFTTNQPAYYECPNPKYPVLYFKTSVHPQDFCIPCCKKAVLMEGSKHGHIYNQCMANHTYSTTNKNVVKSTYIVSYGKDIEPGRLSKLPESSLDQLFYQQYSATGRTMDEECASSVGYYIYGVSQSIGMVSNVGLVNTFAHAMGLQIDKLIDETTSRIVKNTRSWNLIMSGRISMYFKSPADFTAAMSSTFLSQSADIEFDNWNDAFVDIARIFWGINIIKFIDNGRGSTNIFIPPNTRNVDIILSPQYKHIIVIQRGDSYLPIYMIDINQFKKDGVIATTVFTNDDRAIFIMRDMLNSVISKLEKGGPPDIHRAISFADDEKDVEISSIYINKKNVCYAATFTFGNDIIYFPVADSLHDHISLPKVDTVFNNKTYKTTWERMSQFMALFNVWAKKNDIATLDVAAWLVVDGVVIGFADQFDMFYYYIAPMKIEYAKKIHDVIIVEQKYNPYDVNMILTSGGEPIRDEKAIAVAMYNHYIYQLFVLEFTAAVNRQKNDTVRSALKMAIKKHINDPSMFLGKIQELLIDWPDDIDMLHSIFIRFTKPLGGKSEYDDLIGYKSTSYTYNDIANIIDDSRFMFDDIIMPGMFKMSREELIDNLQKFMAPLIHISDKAPDIKSFPDAFISCNAADNIEYCNKRQLIVPKNEYDDFIKFLAADILNPIKRRQLLNHMTKSSIGQFRFITRPNENIFVSV